MQGIPSSKARDSMPYFSWLAPYCSIDTSIMRKIVMLVMKYVRH